MMRFIRARRSNTLVVALVLALSLLPMLMSGCTEEDPGPDPLVVIPTAVDNIEAASKTLDDAVSGWRRVNSDLDRGQLCVILKEIEEACEGARSVIASAQADVDTLEPSIATTAALNAIDSLTTLADTAEQVHTDIENGRDAHYELKSIKSGDTLGWSWWSGFIEPLNDRDWAAADIQIDTAEESWADTRASAQAHFAECGDSTFGDCDAYFARTLELVEAGRTLVKNGRNLNLYSRTSVNRFNNQLKTIDEIEDELRDWELPSAWTDNWYYFHDVDQGVQDMASNLMAVEDAVEDTRSALESPQE